MHSYNNKTNCRLLRNEADQVSPYPLRCLVEFIEPSWASSSTGKPRSLLVLLFLSVTFQPSILPRRKPPTVVVLTLLYASLPNPQH